MYGNGQVTEDPKQAGQWAGGLKTGDRVILSGIQLLQEGVPVQPMEGKGPPPKAGI